MTLPWKPEPRPDAAPVLCLRGVSLWRGRRKVLDALHWEVRPGEHWVVVGPNGSGKSTLLHLLQGFLWPATGTVEALGRRFARDDITELRRCTGWVGGEIEALFAGHETFLDLVASGRAGTIGSRFAPVSATVRREARSLLARLGLARLASCPFGRLSQGQRRLASIARVLMQKPGLLLLDEAADGLDPAARAHFLAALERLMAQRRPPAVVFATHHLEEVGPRFTHALLLKAGRAVFAGQVTEAFTRTRLSRLFGAQVEVAYEKGGWKLEVGRRK